ncbi:MAG TPA: hypothetical protein VGC65_10150 [Bacteroidia bacterium]|jgi:hypothetical protein
MKKNRIAAILVVLLSSLSFWYIINNRKGTISAEMKDFAVEDTASVTKIFMADKNGRNVTLERLEDGRWQLNGKYGVRMDALQTLLTTIRRVDVKEPVGKKAQDNVIKRLATKAVKCEIYQKGKLTKAYYVGTETNDLKGTYMIMIDPETMETAARPFVTYIPGFEGYLTTRYFTEERGWRNRTMFQYNPNDIKTVRMEIPYNPSFGYELTVKGNNDYVIKRLSDNKNVENVDPLAVKQYLSYFQELSFESFEIDLNQNEIDSVMKSQPINILTVTDKNGQVNKVKFFARKPKKESYDAKGELLKFDEERMDALMNNGVDFVMVQFYMFGKVMPTQDYFQKGGTQQAKPANLPVNKPKA